MTLLQFGGIKRDPKLQGGIILAWNIIFLYFSPKWELKRGGATFALPRSETVQVMFWVHVFSNPV